LIELTYSRERTKAVELFPRTDSTHQIQYRPISANGQNQKYRPDIEVSLSLHVDWVMDYKLPGWIFGVLMDRLLFEWAFIKTVQKYNKRFRMLAEETFSQNDNSFV
jgi:uncharacterized membrane protein